jgi:C-5 cytosine-specific DNA methylase
MTLRAHTTHRGLHVNRRPMTFLSLFAGIGGFDLALTRLGMRCVGQVEIDPVCRSILTRHFPEVARHDDVRTTIAWWHTHPQPAVDLICAAGPARTSPKPAAAPGSPACARDCSSHSPASLAPYLHAGFCWRTSPDSSAPTRAKTSRRPSPRWMNSGTAFRGACLTRATSESPNAAEECCLSAVVEPCAPSKYCLSPRAARGILRRAARRRRPLPPPLRQALEQLAAHDHPDADATTPTLPSPQP